jgi:hypothetical protein
MLTVVLRGVKNNLAAHFRQLKIETNIMPADTKLRSCAAITPQFALASIHAGYERQRGPGFFGTRPQIRGLAVARTRRESIQTQSVELNLRAR